MRVDIETTDGRVVGWYDLDRDTYHYRGTDGRIEGVLSRMGDFSELSGVSGGIHGHHSERWNRANIPEKVRQANGLLNRYGVQLKIDESAIGKEWEPYRGPKGGEGWYNPHTDEVRYQDDMPGTDPAADAGDALQMEIERVTPENYHVEPYAPEEAVHGYHGVIADRGNGPEHLKIVSWERADGIDDREPVGFSLEPWGDNDGPTTSYVDTRITDAVDMYGIVRVDRDEYGYPVNGQRMDFDRPEPRVSNDPIDYEEIGDSFEIGRSRDKSEQVQQKLYDRLETAYDTDTIEKVEGVFDRWAIEGYYGIYPLWAAGMAMTDSDRVPTQFYNDPLESETGADDITVGWDGDMLAAICDTIRISRETVREIHGDTVKVSRAVSHDTLDNFAKVDEETGEISIRPQVLESWSSFRRKALQWANDEMDVVIDMELPTDKVAFWGPFTLGSTHQKYHEVTFLWDGEQTYTTDRVDTLNRDRILPESTTTPAGGGIMDQLPDDFGDEKAMVDTSDTDKPWPLPGKACTWPYHDREALAKGRRYIGDPDDAPEGVNVEEGPRGGLYYEPEQDRRESANGQSRDTPTPANDEIVGETGTEISGVLQDVGYDGYVVGGTVRDHFLGIESKDVDMATDARPEEMIDLYENLGYRVVPTGIDHGTITVMADGEPIEITTYRVESEYEDGRRPDDVEYVDDVTEDLGRRDLTINAMAYDPISGEVVDPFGGQDDLREENIETVGDPMRRFTEDGLRTLRALRFSAKLDFDIEEDTYKALFADEVNDVLSQVSVERIQEETEKAVLTEYPQHYFNGLLDTGLNQHVIPELEVMVGEGAPADGDLFDHTMRTVDAAPQDRDVRLSALLHDIGKPETDSGEGHYDTSAAIATEILERLHYSNDTIDTVSTVIGGYSDDIGPDMSDAALRELVADVGRDNYETVVRLRQANLVAAENHQEAKKVGRLIDRYNKLEAAGEGVPDGVALDGSDVMDLGIDPGPEISQILDHLHDWVLENPSRNDYETLAEEAARFIDSHGLDKINDRDIREAVTKFSDNHTVSTRQMKGRRYISDPGEAPEDADVEEGPRGGLYYETDNGDMAIDMGDAATDYFAQHGLSPELPPDPDQTDVAAAHDEWDTARDTLGNLISEYGKEGSLEIISALKDRERAIRDLATPDYSDRGNTNTPDPAEELPPNALTEWEGEPPDDFPADLSVMYGVADMSESYRQFRETIRQDSLRDISNRDFHRFGRVFSGDPDYPLQDLTMLDDDQIQTLGERDADTAQRVYAAREGDGMISMYRAVPDHADDIEVGDYVALNPDYVERHGESVLEGQQDESWTVLEETVSIKDVAWPGDAADEFVYSPKQYRDRWASLQDFYEDVSGDTAEKSGGNWVPYRGPRGGDGWYNPQADRVNYDDEPPGSVQTSYEPSANNPVEDGEAIKLVYPEGYEPRERFGYVYQVAGGTATVVTGNGTTRVPADNSGQRDIVSFGEITDDEQNPSEMVPDTPEDVAYLDRHASSMTEAANGIRRALQQGVAPEIIMEGMAQNDSNIETMLTEMLSDDTGITVDGYDADFPLAPEYSAFPEEARSRFENQTAPENVEIVQSIVKGWERSMFNARTKPMLAYAAQLTDNGRLPDKAPNDLLEHVDAYEKEAFEAYHQFATEILRDAVGDTVDVYRGYTTDDLQYTPADPTDVAQQLQAANSQNEDIEMDHRVTESWSTDPKVAHRYAGKGEDGAILKREVPVEQVMLTASTGYLIDGDAEVVVAHDDSQTYSPGQIYAPDDFDGESKLRLVADALQGVDSE